MTQFTCLNNLLTCHCWCYINPGTLLRIALLHSILYSQQHLPTLAYMPPKKSGKGKGVGSKGKAKANPLPKTPPKKKPRKARRYVTMTEEEEAALIAFYEGNECLYNKRSKNFCNKQAKAKLWEDISKEISRTSKYKHEMFTK